MFLVMPLCFLAMVALVLTASPAEKKVFAEELALQRQGRKERRARRLLRLREWFVQFRGR